MGRPLYIHSGGDLLTQLGTSRPKPVGSLDFGYRVLLAYLTEPSPDLQAVSDLSRALADAEEWRRAARVPA